MFFENSIWEMLFEVYGKYFSLKMLCISTWFRMFRRPLENVLLRNFRYIGFGCIGPLVRDTFPETMDPSLVVRSQFGFVVIVKFWHAPWILYSSSNVKIRVRVSNRLEIKIVRFVRGYLKKKILERGDNSWNFGEFDWNCKRSEVRTS